MPIFDQIEVPDSFFQALVEASTVSFLEELYSVSFGILDFPIPQEIIDFVDNYKQNYPKSPYPSLVHFIRVITNDFVQSEKEILNGETYQLIDKAADDSAKQRVYNMIGSDGVLIQEANSYFDELHTYRQHK